jgi:hypothetical protein
MSTPSKLSAWPATTSTTNPFANFAELVTVPLDDSLLLSPPKHCVGAGAGAGVGSGVVVGTGVAGALNPPSGSLIPKLEPMEVHIAISTNAGVGGDVVYGARFWMNICSFPCYWITRLLA